MKTALPSDRDLLLKLLEDSNQLIATLRGSLASIDRALDSENLARQAASICGGSLNEQIEPFLDAVVQDLRVALKDFDNRLAHRMGPMRYFSKTEAAQLVKEYERIDGDTEKQWKKAVEALAEMVNTKEDEGQISAQEAMREAQVGMLVAKRQVGKIFCAAVERLRDRIEEAIESASGKQSPTEVPETTQETKLGDVTLPQPAPPPGETSPRLQRPPWVHSAELIGPCTHKAFAKLLGISGKHLYRIIQKEQVWKEPGSSAKRFYFHHRDPAVHQRLRNEFERTRSSRS